MITARAGTRVPFVVAALAVGVALGLTEFGVPRLIATVHAGGGPALLSDLISRESGVPVEQYQTAWSAVARPALAAFAFLALVAAISASRTTEENVLRRLLGARDGLAGTDVVLIGSVFGLASGALEGGFLTTRHFAMGYVADRWHTDLLWMAPLSATLAFGAVSAGLAIFARAARVRWNPGAIAFVGGGIATWSVCQTDGVALHIAAEVLLAAGVGTALSRIARAAPQAFLQIGRRAAVFGLPAVLVASAVGVMVGPSRSDPTGPAPSPGGTNVLLVILDTVRAANTGLYGYERPTTPGLENWARSGIVFDRAIATAPWTLPSHATMLTGRYNASLGTGRRSALGPQPATLAEVFDAAGYRTGAFVANLAYTTRASGLQRGFQQYRDFQRGPGLLFDSSWLSRWLAATSRRATGMPRGARDKDARTVGQEFLEWLDTSPDRPFFAFLNLFDAHAPYRSPSTYMTRFGPSASGLFEAIPEERGQLELWINQYDGAIAYLDAELVALRTRLAERGKLENTLVIITSDHGEQFGEHGLIGHNGSLYLPALHVPLFMSLPGRLPAGTRVSETVSLRDLAATVLDLTGLPRREIPGESLRELAMGNPADRSPAFSETDRMGGLAPWRPAANGDMKGIVEWPYHYFRIGESEESLFHLVRDPGEEWNLAADDPMVRRLRALVDSLSVSPVPVLSPSRR